MGNSHASRTQPNLDLGLRDNGKFSIGNTRLWNSAKPESEPRVAMENFPLEILTSSFHALKPLQVT